MTYKRASKEDAEREAALLTARARINHDDETTFRAALYADGNISHDAWSWGVVKWRKRFDRPDLPPVHCGFVWKHEPARRSLRHLPH